MSSKKRRAPKGFGSIRRHPDGFWEAYLSLGTDEQGKRIRRHVTAATPELLQVRIQEMQDLARTGRLLTADRTVADWLTHWLHNHDVDDSTFERHRWAVESYLVPGLGAVRLADLRTEHIELALTTLTAKRAPHGPLSASTKFEITKVLRTALSAAVARGHIPTNPATHVALATPDDPVIEPLTTAEATSVFDVCSNRRLGVRWILALMLGLRQSEVLGLWWTDLDLETGTLRVRRQLARRYWRHGCRMPQKCRAPKARKCPQAYRTPAWKDRTKTRAGTRPLHLDPALIELLRAWRRQQLAERLKAGSLWNKDWDAEPWIVTTTTGTPVDHSNDYRDWQHVVADANIRPSRIHDLRHTNATVLLMAGVDTRVVMEMLGWSRASIAARYQHPVSEMVRDASTKVADMLWQRKTFS